MKWQSPPRPSQHAALPVPTVFAPVSSRARVCVRVCHCERERAQQQQHTPLLKKMTLLCTQKMMFSFSKYGSLVGSSTPSHNLGAPRPAFLHRLHQAQHRRFQTPRTTRISTCGFGAETKHTQQPPKRRQKKTATTKSRGCRQGFPTAWRGLHCVDGAAHTLLSFSPL